MGVWLLDADLKFPLRDLTTPANDHLAANLATAVTRALAYLSKTLAEKAVIQQGSAQLGLTVALTQRLVSDYAVVPPCTGRAPTGHLAGTPDGAFAATNGVVDYATLKSTFDGWFWAHRVAAIWKKWKITLAELERLTALTAPAQLLDLLTLPLDATGAIASLDRFLRTSRLLRLRDSLPETGITLLEVLVKLNTTGSYANAAAFAADVKRLNEDWLHQDVEALTNSLDLAYPNDYFLAESWERLRRAFYFLEASMPVPTGENFRRRRDGLTIHAKTLKELLRSKFGAETWLTLSSKSRISCASASAMRWPLICSPSRSPLMLPAANGKTPTTCTPTTCSTWRWLPAS